VTGPGFFVLLRRWWWLLAAGAAAGAVVAWLLASRGGVAYEADMKVLVGPVSADYPTLQGSRELGRTYAALASSRPVVFAAARSTRVVLTPAQADTAVSATSNDVTRILDIRVRRPQAAPALRMASAIGAELAALRRRVPSQQADAVTAIMRDPALVPLTHAQRQAVRGAAERAAWPSPAGDLEVVDGPVAHRVKTRVGLIVIVGALAGALAAALAVRVKDGLAAAAAEAEPAPAEPFEVEAVRPDEAMTVAEQWLAEPRAVRGGRT
jgi:hypothetical protein